ASTITNAPPEASPLVPVTSMISVWVAAPSAVAAYSTAALRVAANVSTSLTTTPSSQTRAFPHTSQRTPRQATPIPVKVNVAVAPAVLVATARSRSEERRVGKEG